MAEERGWRLAKNYAAGIYLLNKDILNWPKPRRHIVEEELQQENPVDCRLARCANHEGVLGEIALSSLAAY